MEALEIFRIPLVQIELIVMDPGRDEPSGRRRQIIAQDAERLRRHLYVAPAEQARIIHAADLNRGQVSLVVEVRVQYRAIVLAAGDQGDGLTAEQEVMRIRGMQADGLGVRGQPQREEQGKAMHHLGGNRFRDPNSSPAKIVMRDARVASEPTIR